MDTPRIFLMKNNVPGIFVVNVLLGVILRQC
jgi:hypothetical protein